MKLQDVDYLCNVCVRMCLMLQFARSDAVLLVDMEAKNQISHCLEGYSVSQVRECYSLFILICF